MLNLPSIDETGSNRGTRTEHTNEAPGNLMPIEIKVTSLEQRERSTMTSFNKANAL